MSQSRPGRLARDAVVLLAGGLTATTIVALMFYRPDGPRWPHHVVDGLGWVIVVTAAAMFVVAGIEKLVELFRRSFPS